MKQHFKVSVNKKFSFDLTDEDALPFQANEASFLFARDVHDTIRATIVEEDFQNRHYTFRINASIYMVHIDNELDMLIEKLGFTSGISSLRNDLQAPMPGVIADVMVKAGDQVKTGDGLIVLEAMKMENKLTAPHDSIVKKVHVKKSDSVEKGAVLIEFEKDEENQ